jgi:hypothetical protein
MTMCSCVSVAQHFKLKQENFNPITQCHIPEELNPQASKILSEYILYYLTWNYNDKISVLAITYTDFLSKTSETGTSKHLHFESLYHWPLFITLSG